MFTNIAVHLLKKAGYWYLHVHYVGGNETITYWQATGIKTTQPRYLAEHMRQNKLTELYEEKRQEALCEQWLLQTEPRTQPVSAWLGAWLQDIASQVCQRTMSAYYNVVQQAGIFLDSATPQIQLLTPSIIADYYASLRAKGLSESTVRYHGKVLRAALQSACNRGYLKINPTNGIPFAKEELSTPIPYSVEEQQHLLEVALGSPLYIPIFLALLYGLRRGEICGLCWEDIDFEHALLQIHHNAVMEHDESGRCRIICSETMKTASSRRTFPLHPQLEALLRAYQVQTCHFSGPVFTSAIGGAMRPNTLTKQFRRLLRENGLRPIRFHDLRHSCATEMAHKDCELQTIQSYLGHSNITSTLRYIHPDAQSNCRTLERIERALEAVS